LLASAPSRVTSEHSCKVAEALSVRTQSFLHLLLSDTPLLRIVDIYDGETEPVVYHGKTLTSKLSVREICLAIAKYAFVTSPYPVIISAEIHCGQAQQDMIVTIMTEVFGDALVNAPIEGRPKIDRLPSPENLKGRVLLKACVLCHPLRIRTR
jgi:Phosphatidylinositol-specific phospholipase C, X domain